MLKSTADLPQLPHQPRHAAEHAERWPVICAACGGAAGRVALRRPGQWLSLLLRVQRYRCNSPRCGWQGNIYG